MSASEFTAAMNDLIARVDAAAEDIARQAAHLVEAAAKRRAPVATGTLRRSVRTEDLGSAALGVYSVRVGPTVIYARRVELGFHGADSLGRVYHQNGRPYFTPAVEETTSAVRALAERRWAQALRGA